MKIKIGEVTERGTRVRVLDDVGTYDLGELIRPRLSLSHPPVSFLWWTPCVDDLWSALVLTDAADRWRQQYDCVVMCGMVIFPLTRPVDDDTYVRLAKSIGNVTLIPIKQQIAQYDPSETLQVNVPHAVLNGRSIDPLEALS